MREEAATKPFKAANKTAASCVTRIGYICTKGIQTYTVDKAAIISWRQLLLHLCIELSLPLRFSYLFSIPSNAKLLFPMLYCLVLRYGQGFIFLITNYLTVEIAQMLVRFLWNIMRIGMHYKHWYLDCIFKRMMKLPYLEMFIIRSNLLIGYLHI